MYRVDERDRVVPLEGLPLIDGGAPVPVVLSDENLTLVAYRVGEIPDPRGCAAPRFVGPGTPNEEYAIVAFRAIACMFGPPNDEAADGHPLYSRGLLPYDAWEVLDSSWNRELIGMNEVHPRHSPEVFAGNRHLVLMFHDSTFECIARSFDLRDVLRGTRSSVVARMAKIMETSV